MVHPRREYGGNGREGKGEQGKGKERKVRAGEGGGVGWKGREGKRREERQYQVLDTDIFLMKSWEICILSHLSYKQLQRIPTITYC